MNFDRPSITWPTGFSVHPVRSRPSPELVSAFKNVPSAHVSDCLGRSVGGLGLRAFHASGSLCGPAVTVRTRPGDNLMIHVAMDQAQPGDVIVVDGSGDLTQAVVGGLMRTTGLKKGLGGFVINGAIRDVAEWKEGQFPCYALGCIHRGPSKEGPGEVNIPISCAGLSVNPGDLIIGDDDGVIAVPAEKLPELLIAVRAHAEKENRIRAATLAGTSDPKRFEAILKAKGVRFGDPEV